MIFRNILKKYLLNITLLLLLTGIINLLIGIINPIGMKLLIDKGIMGKNLKNFLIIAIFIIFSGTILRYLSFLQVVLLQKIKNKIVKEKILELIRKYFFIPYREVSSKNSGYFLSRIYDETKDFIVQSLETFFNFVSSFIIGLTSLCIVLYISWKITVVLLIIIPILYLFSKKIGFKITTLSEKEREKEAKLKEDLVVLFSAYRSVKIFDLLEISLKKITKRMEEYFEKLFKKVETSSFYNISSELILSFAEFFVIIFLGIGVILNLLTIGGLFGFMQAFWKFMNSAVEIVSFFPILSSLKGIYNRIKEMEKFIESQNKELENDEIVLENINFNFIDKLILKDFSMKITKGEKVLISGPNGSGKTTLLNIISGFLNVDGEIKIPSLRKISASIMPEEFIPGNLLENIKYDELSKAKQERFLHLMNSFNLISKLSLRPEDLSAGEKTKFLVIRTLLKDADFYIFDEPLSNVDVESKEKVINKILEETKGKTLIVVMHGDENYRKLFEKNITLKQEVI